MPEAPEPAAGPPTDPSREIRSSIGRAPAAIPVPGLSVEELRQRQDDLKDAAKLHASILESLDRTVPILTEALVSAVKLERMSTSVPSNRAARLSRRLCVAALKAAAATALRAVKLASATRRTASRGLEEAEVVVLDPALLR